MENITPPPPPAGASIIQRKSGPGQLTKQLSYAKSQGKETKEWCIHQYIMNIHSERQKD